MSTQAPGSGVVLPSLIICAETWQGPGQIETREAVTGTVLQDAIYKMLQGLAHIRVEKQTQGCPSNAFCPRQSETLFTLFYWSEKNHCVSFQCEFIWMYHCVSARRVLSLHISRQSASKGCCSRDQRIRAFTTLTALFAFYFQDRKRSHPLYLVRLELSNILHCMASLDLSDVQRFLGDWNLSSLALHVTFAVLWELDKAGAILKSLVSDGVPPRAYYLLFLSLFVSSCLAALELWQPRHPARGSGIQEHAKSLTGKWNPMHEYRRNDVSDMWRKEAEEDENEWVMEWRRITKNLPLPLRLIGYLQGLGVPLWCCPRQRWHSSLFFSTGAVRHAVTDAHQTSSAFLGADWRNCTDSAICRVEKLWMRVRYWRQKCHIFKFTPGNTGTPVSTWTDIWTKQSCGLTQWSCCVHWCRSVPEGRR